MSKIQYKQYAKTDIHMDLGILYCTFQNNECNDEALQNTYGIVSAIKLHILQYDMQGKKATANISLINI